MANFKTATGELAVFLFLIGYVYTSSIILMVGVELDELLREDAMAGRRAFYSCRSGRQVSGPEKGERWQTSQR